MFSYSDVPYSSVLPWFTGSLAHLSRCSLDSLFSCFLGPLNSCSLIPLFPCSLVPLFPCYFFPSFPFSLVFLFSGCSLLYLLPCFLIPCFLLPWFTGSLVPCSFEPLSSYFFILLFPYSLVTLSSR